MEVNKFDLNDVESQLIMNTGIEGVVEAIFANRGKAGCLSFVIWPDEYGHCDVRRIAAYLWEDDALSDPGRSIPIL